MNLKNLVYTEVASTPYADNVTTIDADSGAVFPATPFEATVFNLRKNPGKAFNEGEAMIINVSNVTTNTLTFTPVTTQIALSSAIDWAVIVGVTKGVLDGKEDADATILKEADIVNDLTTGGATVPPSAETVKTLDGKFKILQVVHATETVEFSTTSTTYADTGLEATITPTASTSKIYVIVNQQFSINSSSAGGQAGINLLRGATIIHEAMEDGSGPTELDSAAGGATSTQYSGRLSIIIEDSPATTSATTYKTQGASRVGTLRCQRSNTTVSGKSYITLIEVAG